MTLQVKFVHKLVQGHIINKEIFAKNNVKMDIILMIVMYVKLVQQIVTVLHQLKH